MKGFFKFGNPVILMSIKEKKIEFLVDTGFNGYIMLPQNLIENLGFELIGYSDYLTASGEERITNVYKAEIEFFDGLIEVLVLSTDAYFSLAGMDLFHQCKIIIERHKGMMEILKS